MVYWVKGESTALISLSPLLRSLLPPSFPLPSALLPAYTQLPSSHFLLFFILKNKQYFVFLINLLLPPSHLTSGFILPPFPHARTAQVPISAMHPFQVMHPSCGKSRSAVEGTVSAPTTLHPIFSASALLSLNLFGKLPPFTWAVSWKQLLPIRASSAGTFLQPTISYVKPPLISFPFSGGTRSWLSPFKMQ